MADSELKELLTDFQNLAESEHHSFLATIVNNFTHATTMFGALALFEDRQKPSELLQPLCDLLFTIYRNTEMEFRQFALQFLPNLAYLYLQNYSDRASFHCIETWLVAVHNIEVVDEEAGKKQSFKVPTLSISSIYHESSQISESRIFSVPDVVLERGLSSTTVAKPPTQQVTCINAQNRNKVLTQLFGVFTRLLGEYNKLSLDLICRLCTRMVNRGFNISGSKKSHKRNLSYGSESGVRSPRVSQQNRIPLPSAVFLEMLHLGYFAIFNGYGSVGTQLVRDIEFRGRHDSLANVMLLSRAVLQLAVRATGSADTPHIATPSQLTKNMITNASFRTKKLDGDIPKVDSDDEGVGAKQEGDRMGVISEEMADGETGQTDKTRAKDGEAANIADKIKAKMENVRDNVRMPIRKKEKEKERGISEGSDKDERNKGGEKRDKRREKQKSESRNHITENDHSSDELIRMNTLPTETLAIHSPESGNTSIF